MRHGMTIAHGQERTPTRYATAFRNTSRHTIYHAAAYGEEAEANPTNRSTRQLLEDYGAGG
jgi:hypothetical protein